MAYIDLSGKTFGCWTVLNRTSSPKVVYYNCICKCGVRREVLSVSLRNGKSVSCGCLQPSQKYSNPRFVYKTTFNSWVGMKQRCDYPKHSMYHRYGGRGVSYDPSWKVFSNFLADMRPKPEGMSIERLDNDKDYSKANCCWATREEQASNTSRNVDVHFEGKIFTLKRLAAHVGVTYDSLHNGYRTKGLSLIEALSQASPLVR